MVEIGRITSRRGAIALLVFLCVSAVLFIVPWIFSVFYESDPYENWNEKVRIRTREEEGNMTLLCTSGPCVTCTSNEKGDPKFKCSLAGYHKALECVRDRDAADVLPERTVVDGGFRATKDPVHGRDRTTDEEQKADEGAINERRLLKSDNGVHKIIIYKTCIPKDVKEKLSVFGFEGTVLVCLMLSAPAVHYRKKRAATVQGMQRIPSTARF